MKVKKIPMRRCVGCMESKPKMSMIRLVADQSGNVVIDKTGKANGRGIYLCLDETCFATARKKKAITRNLEVSLTDQQLDQLFEDLSAYERKNP